MSNTVSTSEPPFWNGRKIYDSNDGNKALMVGNHFNKKETPEGQQTERASGDPMNSIG